MADPGLPLPPDIPCEGAVKIAAYCRVSTDKDEQLSSLDHQREFFTAYARRNGYALVGLYADEGISGTSLKKREEFKRLMRDAEKGLFQTVVVKDVSRFARNTVDALQSVRALKALGINTMFLTANMDSMGDSEFILTLFSAMAQEESANISRRTKFGKRINAEKGRVPQCVFGYDRMDNFTLEINPGEARIVRRIFSLYNHQGLGCRTISMTLNRDGDKTKFGNAWNAQGVRRVLTNPLYCGILINHKYEVENFLTGRQILLPQTEQFFHQRPNWAIVSPEDFQKAQQILESRRKQYDSGEPFQAGRYSGRHLFSTLIKCEHCGRSFCRKTYTYANTRVYWRCATNDRYTAARCDNRVCLDEQELIARLRAYFSSRIGDKQAFTHRVLCGLEQVTAKTGDPAPRQAELEARRKKLQNRKERYQEMYANDLLSLSELRERTEKIQAELDSVSRNLEQTARLLNPPESPAQHFTAQIHRFLSLETVTNADLRCILEYITVNRDGNVRIVLKKLEKPNNA